MELLLTLAMKFWMWTVLIELIIIGFIINLFDKKQNITHLNLQDYVNEAWVAQR